MGTQFPSPKGAQPQFSANASYGQTAGRTKMPVGMLLRPRLRRHCVHWGPSPTQFLAHVYCGQTAGWIKTPLGTEVNLGPCDAVLDGVAAPPKRGTAPQFSDRVYCVQTAGWMNMPLGTEVDLGPATLC